MPMVLHMATTNNITIMLLKDCSNQTSDESLDQRKLFSFLPAARAISGNYGNGIYPWYSKSMS